MPLTDIDPVLIKTLSDRRLSGSEREALRQVLDNLHADTPTLAFYRHRAFELARAETTDPQVLDWLEDVLKLLQAPVAAPTSTMISEACFSPGHPCADRIAGLFARARRTVDACVFTITDDRIASAMLEAHRRGIALRVITDNDKALDLGSDIERLRAAGIRVRIDRTAYHMHHKFAVFDGDMLLNGSYNWTRSAAENNHENFVLTGDRRLIDGFAAAFEKLWNDLA